VLRLQPQRPSTEVQACGQVELAKGTGDGQSHPLGAVEFLNAEAELVDLGTIYEFHQQFGRGVIHACEVEVCGEAPSIPRPELPQRGPTLESDTEVEEPFAFQMREQVVLRDVDDCRPSTAAPTLIVSGEIPLGDHSPLTSMPVESITSYVESCRPGRDRSPR